MAGGVGPSPWRKQVAGFDGGPHGIDRTAFCEQNMAGDERATPMYSV